MEYQITQLEKKLEDKDFRVQQVKQEIKENQEEQLVNGEMKR